MCVTSLVNSSNGSSLAEAEHHRPAERPTPFVYISTLHSWLLVFHLAQTDGDPLFLVKQYTLSSAYPVTMLTDRTSIVSPLPPSPFLVAVAKLSASFSQKWYPARRHAPLKSEAYLAARDGLLERLLQMLWQSAEFALTSVLA